MDATIAISEAGINVLTKKAIALAHASKSDSNSWGPFTVGYSASVTLSGGSASLENAPGNRLHLNNVNVSASLSASFAFDLGKILPKICIPPFRVCVNIPFLGRVCTPQICIGWPVIHVGMTFPLAFALDVAFGFRVDDLGSKWGVVLLIDPFSVRFDLSPMADVIIDAIQNEVSTELGKIPLIGGLIADLINTVIGALSGVLGAVLSAFSFLINAVLSLLDLLNVSIPYTLLTFEKTQTFLPANVPGAGDAPVNMSLAALSAQVLDRELVTEGSLA